MIDKAQYELLRPQEICPNCWGKQSYEGQFHDAMKDLQIEVNNHRVMKSFIQKFGEEHLTGSYLQKEEHENKIYCPKCHQRLPYHYHHFTK